MTMLAPCLSMNGRLISFHKLILRSLRLIREITGCSSDKAEAAFSASGNKPKLAIVMVLLNVDRTEAERRLNEADGHISAIINTKEKP